MRHMIDPLDLPKRKWTVFLHLQMTLLPIPHAIARFAGIRNLPHFSMSPVPVPA